jgi:hypothetical protein
VPWVASRVLGSRSGGASATQGDEGSEGEGPQPLSRSFRDHFRLAV